MKLQNNKISTTMENYLKIIYAHTEWQNKPIVPANLATKLDVTPATVSETIKKLVNLNLITYKPYLYIKLTTYGQKLALQMLRKHRLLELYLVKELGYSWDEVHIEAEHLEHAISNKFLEKIDKKLGKPTRDPHGDPIPNKNGEIYIPQAENLLKVTPGKVYKIVRISDNDTNILKYLDSLGIYLDTKIFLEKENKIPGNLSIKIYENDTKYNLSNHISHQCGEKIWVS